MKKLYVKFKKPRTIHQFLYLFYTDVKRTRYCTDYLYADITYSDSDCTQIQDGRTFGFRSFDDLFILIKTYYPSVTKKIVFKRLLSFSMTYNNIQYYPYIGYCSGSGIIRYFLHKILIVDQNLTRKMINCEHTWAELCEMSSIKPTKADVKKYIKNNLKTIKYENNKFQSKMVSS